MLGDFNGLEFNTTYLSEVYASGLIIGAGGFTGRTNMVAGAKGVVNGDGALAATIMREFRVGGVVAGDAILIGNGNMSFMAVGAILGDGNFTGKANLQMAAAGAFDGAGGFTGRANIIMETSAIIAVGSELVGKANVIFAEHSDVIAGTVTLTGNLAREVTAAGVIESSGLMEANASHFRIESISFSGNFAPNDVIVIDAKKMTVTRNGVNAFQLMQGDFFNIRPGGNSIVYADGGSSRTVRIRITHRDKYLY
ncbi:phage distal tail protein [Paenibacillus cymbidii]|uniref:phage distal tail protein n=1 Tax=Paenibacillus cymbidii TaxID=1639034 RepID=UPI00107FF412|nr:phage tail domain-containing protein [Paenibacillus cymbidii]